MALSKLTAQLNAFREQNLVDQSHIYQISQESPLERMRREIQEELEQAERYRASILQNVTTFAGLSSEAIYSAARSMEEVYYNKGDIIINQDDIGDSFYVLEEGTVSVSRKANSKDPNEIPKELVRLGKNSHFGEIALLTAEPRSATVTVISKQAKCLRMTKQKFDDLLATTNQIQVENRKQIGRDVLDTVPLFKSLTSVNKKKLLDAMLPMSYHPNSYICRQGTTGNVFFILTEGTCRVTVNTQEGHERELAKLHPGDFFGEVALIESSNRRTANVISLENVNCLTLSRNDFNRLLKSLKVKILEHQATRGVSTQQAEQNAELKQLNSLSKKRRISGYNTHGQRDELRISNILKRFARFTTESLWNSLYSRMYREMLLDPNKISEYGKYAAFIMKSNDSRWDAVKSIGEQAHKSLEAAPSRRNAADHSFIFGLLKQRNALKDRLCKNWPIHQYMLLCKKAKIMRVKSFRKIIEVDTRGTTVFLILRGAVRIFSRMPGTNSKVIYEEDLFPGEIFGEAVLSGMHTRLLTALSITCVDLAVIDDQDYMTAQDRDSVHMGTEEKSKFLAKVPMLRNWDSYKLLRLAHALVQEEIDKGTVVTRHFHPSKDIYFIVNGRVDIFDSLHKKNVITTLLKHDYLGESGFLQKYMHKIPGMNNHNNSNSTAPTASSGSGNGSSTTNSFHQPPNIVTMNKILATTHNKVLEEFYAVATTKLEVLILNESNFHLFDIHSIEAFRDAFFSKIDWRRDRVHKMKLERASLRKKYAKMRFEANFLPTWGATEVEQPTSEDVATYDDDSNASQIKALAEVKYTVHTNPNSPRLDGVPGSPNMSPPLSPPYSRPTSPNPAMKKGEEVITGLSRLDRAYQTALVHPLDDRLNNEKFWTSNDPNGDKDSPELPEDDKGKDGSERKMKRITTALNFTTTIAITPQEKLHMDVEHTLKNVNYAFLNPDRTYLLNNLADIPIILAQDYDYLMVSSSCHPRFFDKTQEFLKTGKRPLSGKSVPYRSLSNDLPPTSRPSTATVSPISPSRRFRDSMSREMIMKKDGVAMDDQKELILSNIPSFDDQEEMNKAMQVVSFDFTDEDHRDSEQKPPKDALLSPSGRRKSSNFALSRKASTVTAIKSPFSLPTETDKPNSPTHKDKKNEYRFKFVDEQELAPEPVDDRQQSPVTPVRRASTSMNLNVLTRPVSSPQLTIPTYDTAAANLMIIKPLSSKTPTAAMIAQANGRGQSREVASRSGQNVIEQLITRPPSKRKSSVIAIDLDHEGNEISQRTGIAEIQIVTAGERSGAKTAPSTPYTLYQKQHQSSRRPQSGGVLNTNTGQKLPEVGPLSGYSFNAAAMSNPKTLFASRHHSANNLKGRNGSSNNISVRGQYVMVNPQNSSIQSPYLSTPVIQADSPSWNGTNDIVAERRSNQPPRLLPTPSGTGSKLLNTRRKNNVT